MGGLRPINFCVDRNLNQFNATEEQVRAAYHKLARIYHPDSGSKPDHDRMVELNEAYRMAASQKLLT